METLVKGLDSCVIDGHVLDSYGRQPSEPSFRGPRELEHDLMPLRMNVLNARAIRQLRERLGRGIVKRSFHNVQLLQLRKVGCPHDTTAFEDSNLIATAFNIGKDMR